MRSRAYRLGAAFVPARKAGKLPWAVAREEYILEYGVDRLEIHRDGVGDEELDDLVRIAESLGTRTDAHRILEDLDLPREEELWPSEGADENDAQARRA